MLLVTGAGVADSAAAAAVVLGVAVVVVLFPWASKQPKSLI